MTQMTLPGLTRLEPVWTQDILDGLFDSDPAVQEAIAILRKSCRSVSCRETRTCWTDAGEIACPVCGASSPVL